MCVSSLFSSSTAKKGTAKLLLKTKMMLCNASMVDGRTLQPDLPVSLQNFLDQTTTADTLEHLCGQLLQWNCICGITLGALIAMNMGHFTWILPDIPTNFTVCALPQHKEDTLDVVGLVVKAAKGKGLGVSDTKSPTKLHLQVLALLNSTRHMFNNLAMQCTKITGNTSLPTHWIFSWLTFFHCNVECLIYLGTKDPAFFTKVLYLVDTAKEAYLQEYSNVTINPNLIKFESLKTQILSHQYFILLPPVLKILMPMLNPMPSDHSHTKTTSKPTLVTNKHGNQNMLVARTDYKALIYDNVKNGHVQPPIWDKSTKKPACICWHFKQICSSACLHTATHTHTHIHTTITICGKRIGTLPCSMQKTC
eukprot:15364471-Ditylum_brightwellii.AAC.1